MSSAVKNSVSLDTAGGIGGHSLTRVTAVAIMVPEQFQLLRRITTCLLLVALAGIYAAPLAATFAPTGADCCAAGMCPLQGHSHTRQHSGSHNQSHQKMADCGMGSEASSMRMCEMGACGSKNENVIRVALVVLSAPVQLVHSPVEVSIPAQAFEPEHLVSQIPETPPPRITLS
jgi:hypothetical protein